MRNYSILSILLIAILVFGCITSQTPPAATPSPTLECFVKYAVAKIVQTQPSYRTVSGPVTLKPGESLKYDSITLTLLDVVHDEQGKLTGVFDYYLNGEYKGQLRAQLGFEKIVVLEGTPNFYLEVNGLGMVGVAC